MMEYIESPVTLLQNGVTFTTMLRVKRDPTKSEEECIAQAKKALEESLLKDRCKELGLDFKKVQKYINDWPSVPQERIISFLLHSPKGKPFKVLCQENGIDYTKAREYKKRHPELTEEEILSRYNPLLVQNIFGDLVV